MDRGHTQFMCYKHKQDVVEYLLVNGQPGENIFICSRQFPYFDDQKILENVDSFVNLSNDEYRNGIQSYFHELKQEISQKIDNVCDKVIQKEVNISEKQQNVKQSYLELFQIDNILKIIDNQNDDLNTKSQKICEIFNNLEENQKVNSEKLKQQLIDIRFKNLFEKDKFRLLKDSILNQISLFNQEYVSQSQIVANDTLNSMKKLKLIKDDDQLIIQKETGGNLDYILKFVSNKANQCRKEYLSTLENELLSVQHIINNLNIETYHHEYPKEQVDLDLSDLSKIQINGLINLTNKMRQLNTEYGKQNPQSNQMSFSLQPSSKYIINNIFQHDKLLTKSKIDQIESYLKSFPIFELCNFIDPSIFNFQIQKSSYSQSQCFVNIKLNQENKYQISNQCDSYTISYIKINQENTYNVCLKFNFANNTKYINPFYVGLVSYKAKDTPFRDQNLANIFEKICAPLQPSPIQFEIQFSIKNKQFQILQLGSLQQEPIKIDFQLQDNVEYFLAIHLFILNNILKQQISKQ